MIIYKIKIWFLLSFLKLDLISKNKNIVYKINKRLSHLNYFSRQWHNAKKIVSDMNDGKWEINITDDGRITSVSQIEINKNEIEKRGLSLSKDYFLYDFSHKRLMSKKGFYLDTLGVFSSYVYSLGVKPLLIEANKKSNEIKEKLENDRKNSMSSEVMSVFY
jgi:hypothetical protein